MEKATRAKPCSGGLIIVVSGVWGQSPQEKGTHYTTTL